MFTNAFFTAVAIAASLLVSLSTGIVYSFALLVMRGNGRLPDGQFISSFQEIDGIIQRNDGLFILTWMGSVLTLILALISGWNILDGPPRLMLAIAAGIYLLAFQLPTFLINIPLNTYIQSVDVKQAGAGELWAARERFEKPWNRANTFRSVSGVVTMLLLFGVLAGT
jgi:uncharacterized membrane protein